MGDDRPLDEGFLARGADHAPTRHDIVMWALAAAAFALAMWLSARSVSAPHSQDLRTPAILVLDTALATAVALVFARHSAFTSASSAWWCLFFGMWAAAAFRLVPPMPGENVLYVRNVTSDAWALVLGAAAVHGFIAFLLALPYARRVLSAQGRLGPDRDRELWELAGATIVIFFVVTAIVRVYSELEPFT